MSNRMVFMRLIYDAIPISSRRSITTLLHGNALFTVAPSPGLAVTHIPKTFGQFEYLCQHFQANICTPHRMYQALGCAVGFLVPTTGVSSFALIGITCLALFWWSDFLALCSCGT